MFSEDKASDFACFQTGKENQQAYLEEVFQTSRILLSFGGTAMDVKSAITASTLAVMSYDEVIADLAVARRMVVIKTKRTT